MFSIKVDRLAPFLNATSLFTQITDEVCLKFTPWMFSIIVRCTFPPLNAELFMPHPLFAEYSVGRNHISKVSLNSFHNALLEGQSYGSMTIHLQEPQNNILLTFAPLRALALPLQYELTFLPMEEDWAVYPNGLAAKCFSFESGYFRIFLRALFPIDHERNTALITSKGSNVTFAAFPYEGLTLSQESGTCLIIGDREIEMQLCFHIHPASFFYNCAIQVQRVWFFKKNDSCALIYFPFTENVHYLIISIPQI